jgi:hypothetical protein
MGLDQGGGVAVRVRFELLAGSVVFVLGRMYRACATRKPRTKQHKKIKR